MALTPSSDLSAASWIAASGQSWHQLTEFGPSGFAAYARLRFLPDPAHASQSENDVDIADDAPSETAQLQAALEVLTPHTRTPDDCYFCLWDGWGWSVEGSDGAWALNRQMTYTTPSEPMLTSAPPPGSTPALRDRSNDPPSPPRAPMVAVPNRAYFLFHGTISDLGDWGAAGMGPAGSAIGMPDPALIWPADHAWCLANDVDPHWAGIGAASAAIDQLLADPRLDVVPADPLEDQPRYW